MRNHKTEVSQELGHHLVLSSTLTIVTVGLRQKQATEYLFDVLYLEWNEDIETRECCQSVPEHIPASNTDDWALCLNLIPAIFKSLDSHIILWDSEKRGALRGLGGVEN